MDTAEFRVAEELDAAKFQADDASPGKLVASLSATVTLSPALRPYVLLHAADTCFWHFAVPDSLSKWTRTTGTRSSETAACSTVGSSTAAPTQLFDLLCPVRVIAYNIAVGD